MFKPRIPKDATEELRRRRLHNSGDLKAYSGPQTGAPHKQRLSEEIEQQTAEFEANGGEVEVIAPGETNYEQGRAFVISAATNNRAT